MKRYKIKSYKGYKKRSIKKQGKSIIVGCIFVGILIYGYNFLVTGETLIKQFRLKDDKGFLPISGYMETPNTDFSLYRQPVEVKGIYVSGNSAGSSQIDKLIELCNQTELNAMVIDVKSDNGYLTFSTDNPIIKQAGLIPKSVPIKDIRALMNKLYENNIYPIARITTFKDNVIGSIYPEYMLRNKDGTLYLSKEPGGTTAAWLNPYNKDVWEYILVIAKEAAKVGFKEIQFDYIRFHEGTNKDKVNFGYNSEAKSKIEIISEFTEYIVEQLHEEGVYVSADVFGAIITSKIDAQIVGQDYAQMSKYLDYICPMIYPSHYANGSFGVEHPDLQPYEIILNSMEISSDKLKAASKGEHQAIVRPWLQDFTAKWVPAHQVYGPKEIRKQIQGVYDAGLYEWLLWNASNKYTKDGLLAQ